MLGKDGRCELRSFVGVQLSGDDRGQPTQILASKTKPANAVGKFGPRDTGPRRPPAL
jgi:hypothetical protein